MVSIAVLVVSDIGEEYKVEAAVGTEPSVV